MENTELKAKELASHEVYELPACEAVGTELASPLWSDGDVKIAFSPSEIMSPAETMSPGSSGDGIVSPLSPAGRPGRFFFGRATVKKEKVVKRKPEKKHDTYYHP